MLRIFGRLKKTYPLLFILFLTGCKATYNVSINYSSAAEEVEIIESDLNSIDIKEKDLFDLSRKEYLETNLKWPMPVYNDSDVNPYEPTKINSESYYNTKDISDDSQIGIQYSYNFLYDKYNNSNILNKCYDFELKNENNKITFKTTGTFKCFTEYPLLDEVEINVTSVCDMVSNNSDTNDNSKYTWNITKDNYENKTIEFEFKCKKQKQNNKKTNQNENIFVIGLVVVYICLIAIMISFLKIVFKRKNRL